MHDFKVGDRVAYSTSGGRYGIYRFAGLVGTVQYHSHNYKYATVLWDNGIFEYHDPRHLLPQADLMPPVPNETMYLNRLNTKTLRVSHGTATIALVQSDKAMAITAETALDLAADLTRMALKIKRKQEKDDA